MTWEWVIVVCVVLVLAASLMAWRWWLEHKAEPIDELEG